MRFSGIAGGTICLGIIALVGCSDPARFAEPIATLNTGTGQIVSVVDDAIGHMDDDPEVRRQLCLSEALDSGTRLDIGSIDGAVGNCAAVWRATDDNERVWVAGHHVRQDAIYALADYVAALEKLLQSQEGDPLRAAAYELAMTVRYLNDTTSRLPGSGRFSSNRQSLSGLASFLAAIAPSMARKEALIDAVASADPVIDRLVELIARDVSIAHEIKLGQAPSELASAMQQHNAMLGENCTPAGAAALILVNTMERLRIADPSDAMHRLGTAHDALLTAISDNSTKSYIELVYAVDQFAAAARDAWEIYGAYQSALRQ